MMFSLVTCSVYSVYMCVLYVYIYIYISKLSGMSLKGSSTFHQGTCRAAPEVKELQAAGGL